MQLHQGSGRGTIRRGKPQTVYYCAYNSFLFFNGLNKAFPKATIEKITLPLIEEWKENNLQRDKDYERKKNYMKAARRYKISNDMATEHYPSYQVQEAGPKKYFSQI